MRVTIVLLAATLLLSPGCTVEERTGPPKPVQLLDLLPQVDSMPGWVVSEGPEEYSPDDLYLYNNGAAPGYLAYGFRKLAHARYCPADDEYSGVYIDIYDMGSGLGAYGIYTSARPPEIEPRGWGGQGYSAKSSAAAMKGSLYVYAYVDIVNASSHEMIDRLMAEVTTAIPGEGSPPWILEVLPPGDLVPHTDRYVARDLLGHSFLPGGYLAGYSIAGNRSTLFLSDLGSNEAAIEALARLREYEEANGRIVAEKPGGLLNGFQAEDPGMGRGVVTLSGRYVIGMWDSPSLDHSVRKLEELRKALELH